MNIVLVNPPFNKYAGIVGLGGLSAPLNLACLAAYVREKRKNDQVFIIDADALNYTYDETVKKIMACHPHLIGVTTTTPSFGVIINLLSIIHLNLPNIPIILGGPHATGSPETAVNVPGVTAAVIGEGEITLLEIIENIERDMPLVNIKGIAYKDSKGEAIITGQRESIINLDDLPLPARDLLPMKLYYSPPTKSLGGARIANIVSSRGCPFQCTFCLSDMMWGRKYRRRSVAKIIEEIKECIEKYDCDEFNFNDDLFTADKHWVESFCNKLIENNIKVHWVVMSRADYITVDLLKLMKKAGCEKIAMGLESGSQAILKMMNKKINLEKSIEAVQRIKKTGIQVGASFVLGHIGETATTIKETIKFAKTLNPDTVAFFQASPYPGTRLYKLAMDLGYIRKDAKWIDYAIVSDKPSVLDLPDFSAKEIQKWVKYAYRSFYLNPTYILSRLRQIKSWKMLLDNLKGLKVLFAIVYPKYLISQIILRIVNARKASIPIRCNQ